MKLCCMYLALINLFFVNINKSNLKTKYIKQLNIKIPTNKQEGQLNQWEIWGRRRTSDGRNAQQMVVTICFHGDTSPWLPHIGTICSVFSMYISNYAPRTSRGVPFHLVTIL